MSAQGVPQFLNLGEMGVAQGSGRLQILGLGSCVGLCLWDQANRCGGVAHVVLPESSADPERARRSPGYFADTALPALLEAMGAAQAPGRVIARLVGGAAVLRATTLNVGFRNGEALKRELWQYRVPLVGEELGGEHQRGLSLDVETGRLEIRLAGGGVVYL